MMTIEDPSRLAWQSRIFVAGHSGLIGTALVKALTARGHTSVITADRAAVDLTNQHVVEQFFERTQPEYVVLAAGRCVSACEEARIPAYVLRDHLTIQANVIDSAYSFGARKLIMLATHSIAQPAAADRVAEEARLLDVAKAAGLRMCAAYRQQFGFKAATAVLPTIYGPHDRFSASRPDSIAGYMYALSTAQLRGDTSVYLYGRPQDTIDLLHADDLANALVWLLEDDTLGTVVFVPPAATITLAELGKKLAEIIGYEGEIRFDDDHRLTVAMLPECGPHLGVRGWRPLIGLNQGLAETYAWFVANQQNLRL